MLHTHICVCNIVLRVCTLYMSSMFAIWNLNSCKEELFHLLCLYFQHLMQYLAYCRHLLNADNLHPYSSLCKTFMRIIYMHTRSFGWKRRERKIVTFTNNFLSIQWHDYTERLENSCWVHLLMLKKSFRQWARHHLEGSHLMRSLSWTCKIPWWTQSQR